MRRKIFLSALLVLNLFPGWYSCQSPCGDVEKYFDIREMTISTAVGPPAGSSDGSGIREVTENEEVEATRFGIGILFRVGYYSQVRKKNYLNPGSAAWALSCMESGYGGSPEGLEEIQIITNRDFDATHRAGDPVNDLAQVAYSLVDPPVSVEEFISQNHERITSNRMAIRLRQAPANKSESHSFRVIVKLRNGEVYTGESVPVRFK